MKLAAIGCGLAVVCFATQALSQTGDRPGYVQFMDVNQMNQWKAKAPTTDNAEVNRVIKSPDTMWYDKNTLQPAYQDSVGPVYGVRFNRIGRELAVDGHLVFGTDETFHFPFGHTAGTDQNPNFKVVTFWAPPKVNGEILPVVWYQDDTTRWRWMFPEGTTFGELMLVKDGTGEAFPFELRTRTRYADGWSVNLYRPFLAAIDLAEAIKSKRPNWQSRSSLNRLVQHLENNNTLQAHQLASRYYGEAFDSIDGALDSIPTFGDDALVRDLLSTTTFKSTEGEIWKANNQLETYGPTTDADFSVVPRGYKGGMFAVNEVTCNECHQDTGRQIGEFSFNSVLYGEIWGEDRIFSWHLFDPTARLDGAFDRNRRMNPRLANTGLVVRYDRNRHTAPTYKTLPRRFQIIWR